MTLNILLDLDDTLLDTNLDEFLPAYFKLLASSMSKKIPAGLFVNCLIQSTQVMYASKAPNASLDDVFGENFYPALGVSPGYLASDLEYFYDEIFPSLQPLTKVKPDAIDFVEWAFDKGWSVSIATDPLFPRKAILHRLRWAGLAPEKYPFKFVSDFHRFHFAKVSESFFPELLSYLNWSDEPVLMIGDSVDRDIIPARNAGLKTFHYQETSLNHENPGGNFNDLKRYLSETDLDTLSVDLRSTTALINFLIATGAALHTLTRDLATEDWLRNPGPGEWSVLENICHLRDVDREVNIPRLKALTSGDNVLITGTDTDSWVVERKYRFENPVQAFSELIQTRAIIVDILGKLVPAEWERRARHTILGPTNLNEIVGIIVHHDQLHIQQIRRCLASLQKDLLSL